MSAKTLKAFAVVGEGYGDTPDQLEVAATDGVQLAVFATIPAATDRLEFHGEEVLAVVILPVAEHEALLQEVERQMRFVDINANSAHGKHKEGQRYRDERDALQLRLNAADQRFDELESQLIESRKITLSGCEFSEHELIGRAVRAASGTHRRGTQRWVAMKHAFGCGSGVANAICRRFGFDPDEMVKP
jgi:hypothetical protein